MARLAIDRQRRPRWLGRRSGGRLSFGPLATRLVSSVTKRAGVRAPSGAARGGRRRRSQRLQLPGSPPCRAAPEGNRRRLRHRSTQAGRLDGRKPAARLHRLCAARRASTPAAHYQRTGTRKHGTQTPHPGECAPQLYPTTPMESGRGRPHSKTLRVPPRAGVRHPLLDGAKLRALSATEGAAPLFFGDVTLLCWRHKVGNGVAPQNAFLLWARPPLFSRQTFSAAGK